MTAINQIISPESIDCNVEALSKKRALERLSELISSSESSLSASEVFESLLARERLGATGLGHGVAIPHGRVKNTDHILGAFIKLKSGVDFDAIDNQPVDLLFALLVPEESTDEHLQVLAALASMFNDESFRETLRHATTPEALLALINDWQKTH